MSRLWRVLVWMGVATALAAVAGCVMQNPSYFPHLLPFKEIKHSHAKPPGSSYFSNFDPYACRIEVRPLERSNPVGTEQVIIATIYDANGQPRRGRRVEWMVEGVGHLIEADESGFGWGRGGKVDRRYAITYTEYSEHLVTRGNDDPNDDFMIRPGQTWCVISSPVEGDTHVTAYAPEIHNWDRHKVNVTFHWIDAGWTMPQPAAQRFGGQHTFTTNVFRFSDRMPLANYRVRYTVINGPAAAFLPGRQQVMEAVTDTQGNASVTIMQLEPQAGTNRVGIEIIRPPDPCCPTGPGIIIGRGETLIQWTAPSVTISKVGPPTAAVQQPIRYTITVTNSGQLETEALTVRDEVPPGLRFESSQPPANRDGRFLIWTLGPLPPGRSAAIQATFVADQVGTIENVVSVTTVEGIRAEARATTQITTPSIDVSMTGPSTAVVGSPVTYQITVSNPGTGPATDVVLMDQYDDGLTHASGGNPLRLEIGTLAAGESRTVSITLTPQQAGTFVNRVTATAAGNLRAEASHSITAVRPQLSVNIDGPTFRYARSDIDWTIRVTNVGETALTNVVVRAQLPAEVTFVRAGGGGRFVSGGQVVWTVGTLQPREEKLLDVTARADRVTPRAVAVVTATADPNVSERVEAGIEIRGAPALRLEALDTKDPVEVGRQTTYEISVTNTGTWVATDIAITAALSEQMRIRSGVGPGNAQPQIVGNRITFPTLDSLQPGETRLFSIVGEAVKAGDARCRIELRSVSIGPDPVIEEESTTVFQSVGGGGSASPPPPSRPPQP